MSDLPLLMRHEDVEITKENPMDLVSLQKQALIKLGPLHLINLSDLILRQWRYRFGITAHQVRAWMSDTIPRLESIPCDTPRQVCQKVWREMNVRWASVMSAGRVDEMADVIMDLLLFDARVSVMPILKRTKHSKSRRADRNERRQDILRRAAEEDPIVELYYIASLSNDSSSVRSYRSALKRIAKKNLVQMLKGRPDELRRVLALRRERRVKPMPLSS